MPIKIDEMQQKREWEDRRKRYMRIKYPKKCVRTQTMNCKQLGL